MPAASGGRAGAVAWRVCTARTNDRRDAARADVDFANGAVELVADIHECVAAVYSASSRRVKPRGSARAVCPPGRARPAGKRRRVGDGENDRPNDVVACVSNVKDGRRGADIVHANARGCPKSRIRANTVN